MGPSRWVNRRQPSPGEATNFQYCVSLMSLPGSASAGAQSAPRKTSLPSRSAFTALFGAGAADSRFCFTTFMSSSLGRSSSCSTQPEDSAAGTSKRNADSAAAPAPKSAVNAALDGKLVFLGTDWEPAAAAPGKDIRLTQYWT